MSVETRKIRSFEGNTRSYLLDDAPKSWLVCIIDNIIHVPIPGTAKIITSEDDFYKISDYEEAWTGKVAEADPPFEHFKGEKIRIMKRVGDAVIGESKTVRIQRMSVKQLTESSYIVRLEVFDSDLV